eukprot:TRINITY_DN45041_c0_g1_i1.p2 TRINITY_DN45041_c0_g1~~TRINITY_DN45041_c0_g1_i1.p2  ORF type:complete len:117 (-),score=24.92 TRINITY_DN45041_c0_g1_i1:51-401(-)
MTILLFFFFCPFVRLGVAENGRTGDDSQVLEDVQHIVQMLDLNIGLSPDYKSVIAKSMFYGSGGSIAFQNIVVPNTFFSSIEDFKIWLTEAVRREGQVNIEAVDILVREFQSMIRV